MIHGQLHSNDMPMRTLDLRTVERQTIERALETTRGNLSHAARLLGIDRSTLRRKLSRYANARSVNGVAPTPASREVNVH